MSLNIDKDGFQPEDRPRLQTHMEDWTATNPPDGKEAMVKSTARRKLQKLEERLTASGTPATQR